MPGSKGSDTSIEGAEWIPVVLERRMPTTWPQLSGSPLLDHGAAKLRIGSSCVRPWSIGGQAPPEKYCRLWKPRAQAWTRPGSRVGAHPQSTPVSKVWAKSTPTS